MGVENLRSATANNAASRYTGMTATGLFCHDASMLLVSPPMPLAAVSRLLSIADSVALAPNYHYATAAAAVACAGAIVLVD